MIRKIHKPEAVIELGCSQDFTESNLDWIKRQQEKGLEVQETLVPTTMEPLKVPKKRKSYGQDWTNYNLFQTREKAMCYRLLNDAVDSLDIPEPKNKNGRPTVDIKEIIKCLIVKAYNNCSARRLHSELILFRGLGYLNRTYHFNTVLKYLGDTSITQYLEQAYKLLAGPMVSIDHFFATDATGFSATNKARWSSVRLNYKEHKDYKKLHVTTGTRTNVITSAKITIGTAGDSPYFKPLLDDTAKTFTVKEISADAAYLSRENCAAAEQVGAKPYIMPKKNTTGRSKGSLAWRRMIHFWKTNEPRFRAHYHRRSNVESTFAMIKTKFGDILRGRLDTTKENEIMCKIVCHNLTILAECMLQFGVKPNF